MILAVDVGNTNIVVGTVGRSGVAFVERISTDHKKTDLEYAVMFRTILELHGINGKDLCGSVISSVVPNINNTLRTAIFKVTGEESMIVSRDLDLGLDICIDKNAILGSDLIVDAVAGIAEYPLPLIIIDMGTATTISAIDEKGRYLGGSIIPGASVALESMVSRTAQLPRISFEAPPKAIGKNTIDCMKSGSVFGSAAMLDGMILRFEEELGSEATVVATGGLARFIVPHCCRKIIFDDTLLLKGLYLIYKKNGGSI
jgi:type III pantothenate kinase